MASFKTYLEEKTDCIERLKNEVCILNRSKLNDVEAKRGQLQELLESHLMTEGKWEKFKEAFYNEHLEFYRDLIEKYPELTESNLRYVFLKKLGLKNMEISSLLGVTEDAVRKGRQRLKKKLGNIRFDVLSDELLL